MQVGASLFGGWGFGGRGCVDKVMHNGNGPLDENSVACVMWKMFLEEGLSK